MPNPIVIDYYTDVLCVWAWIAQRRIDELTSQYGDSIHIQPHYINLFGDTQHRMATQWAAKGGFEGFAQHVREAAQPFDDAPVSADIWGAVKPATSANAHLILKAVEITASVEQASELARIIRSRFFEGCLNIGQYRVLLELIKECGYYSEALVAAIEDGSAMAALMNDYQLAQSNNIKGSPSWVLDGGRQVLYGNVGYRVLSANVEELLRNPVMEASWC